MNMLSKEQIDKISRTAQSERLLPVFNQALLAIDLAIQDERLKAENERLKTEADRLEAQIDKIEKWANSTSYGEANMSYCKAQQAIQHILRGEQQ